MLSDIALSKGAPSPLGFSVQKDVANFALFSSHATKVILGIAYEEEMREIPLNRTGDIWHIALQGWKEGMKYSFRLDGPYDGKSLYRFDLWLADPVSKHPDTSVKWGEGAKSIWSLCLNPIPFDWENDQPPSIPLPDLIIYEMHVRGFTFHASSQVKYPGTFQGIIEKIPHLLELGVNAVELMPIFEFDEAKSEGPHLRNYWGYDPLFYFAPMRRYSANPNAVLEFKTLVRELHKKGIEVILDVVFNHTGEWGDKERYIHFRGIDNSVYYLVDEEGNYLDFTGCKNTVNANHPAVSEFILTSLRYFVQEMHVDGFRFDLASILTRGTDGKVMKEAPLIKAIVNDPIFKNVKLIAESWDAAGLYQLGHFPDFGPWSEWNGNFRDRVRNFIKGTDGFSGPFADVFCGSEFLYKNHSPCSSINFITAHDGFTLNDLVSYNQKHNLDNEQQNRDGNSQNFSWNCGVEGVTNDPAINELRAKQMRNFLLTLFLSQGIPMLFMGDEYGHTRKGNNNPFVQDNELNWFLWDQLEKKKEILSFVSGLIHLRKTYPIFRSPRFFTTKDIDWHGETPHEADWSPQNRFVACTLKGNPSFYIAFNAGFNEKKLTLPQGRFHEVVRTEKPWNEHFLKDPFKGPLLENKLTLPPYSAILAVQEK
ncbi:MAG: glycogen-debranching protein [Chlamydiae bacterium]|nr:glycogen-debranching protein [Chlamydiota bacterium]